MRRVFMWQALPDVVYVKTAAADSQPVTYGQYSNLVIYRSVTVITYVVFTQSLPIGGVFE